MDQIVKCPVSSEGCSYASEGRKLKIVPQKPESIVIDPIAEHLGAIGAIHYTPSHTNFKSKCYTFKRHNELERAGRPRPYEHSAFIVAYGLLISITMLVYAREK